MGRRLEETVKEWDVRIKAFFLRGRVVKINTDGGTATFVELGPKGVNAKCVNAEGKIEGFNFANLVSLNVPRKQPEQ
jgi:hypothetical protein